MLREREGEQGRGWTKKQILNIWYKMHLSIGIKSHKKITGLGFCSEITDTFFSTIQLTRFAALSNTFFKSKHPENKLLGLSWDVANKTPRKKL